MPPSAQDKLWQRVSGVRGPVWHPAAMRTGESRWDGGRSRWDEPLAPAMYAASKVPLITVYFWIIKLLTTAMGEATSDYMVRTINPVIAVLFGFTAFVIAMVLVPRQALRGLDLLAGRRHGRGVRHAGRRRPAHQVPRPVRGIHRVLRGRTHRDLHRLVPGGGDAVHPQHSHPPTGTVLLGDGAGHVRARHRDRRPDRQDPGPGLPRLGHLVLHRVRGGGRGALEVRPEPDPGFLDLLRADPAGRCFVCGLRGVPALGGRLGCGAWAGRAVPDVPDRHLRRIPDGDPQGCRGTRWRADPVGAVQAPPWCAVGGGAAARAAPARAAPAVLPQRAR